MESAKNDDKVSPLDLSSSNDDSLVDFKSPKSDSAVQAASSKIVNDKRVKKPSAKGKKTKESRGSNRQLPQPSIESSFFKAAINSNKNEAGYTCPLCIKRFTDAILGVAHTKSCASKNKVSSEKLLAAVALQERQGNERLAIGLPIGPLVQTKPKIPRQNRARGVKEDTGLQLALALSESLQAHETENKFEEAILLAGGQYDNRSITGTTDPERRKTLQNFGFLTSKAPTAAISDGPIKPRRKKRLGPTTLQTRSQETRDRLLTEKIVEILMCNEAVTQVCEDQCPTIVNTEEKISLPLKSSLLKDIHRVSKRLWDSAQLSSSVTNFYVENLGPVVVPIVDQPQENSAANINNNDDTDSAERIEIKSPEIDKHPEEMSESPENYIRPCIDNIHITDRQYRNSLPTDWSSILNVSSVSDVVVIVKNNHIWAHKLVFHVRCSDILLDCDANNDTRFSHVKEKISWLDVDFETALTFLEFVYSGVIEKNLQVFTDDRIASGVRRLARKYRLRDLFDYMRKKRPDVIRANSMKDLQERRAESRSPIVIDVPECNTKSLGKTSANAETRDFPVKKPSENAKESDPHHEAVLITNVDVLSISSNERENAMLNSIENAKMNDSYGVVRSPLSNDQELNPPKNLKSKDHEAEGVDVLSISSNEGDGDMLNSLKNAKLKDSRDIARSPFSNDRELNSPENVKTKDPHHEVYDVDVMSISSNEEECAMSPDIFDDTIEEPEDISKYSQETANKKPQESTNDNSNLKVLAQLIAEEDLSPTIKIHEQQPITSKGNETPERIPENYNSLSQNHMETPKSRGASYLAGSPRLVDQPRSQRLPEKQKSNLSLFIEKVQKGNAKSAFDSYTDEESLVGPIEPMKIRNCFAKNNTDDSMSDMPIVPRRCKSGQGALTALEEDLRLLNEMRENSVADDSIDLMQSNVDDSTKTNDEDISMYSKYRKTHAHNNSISRYRNMLKNLNETEAPSSEEIEDFQIDLTQDSDTEIDTGLVPFSSTRRSNKRISSDGHDDSRESESSKTIPNTPESNAGSPESPVDRASLSLCQISVAATEISKNDKPLQDSADGRSDCLKSPRDSVKYPDLDVFDIDEEMFVDSQRHLRSSPHPLSGDSEKFEDNHAKTTENKSADKSLSPGYSPEYLNFDDQIYTQSMRASDSSRCRIPSPDPEKESENDDRNALRVPSPILILSSPEMDANSQIYVAIAEQDSNKENAFVSECDEGLLSSRESKGDIAGATRSLRSASPEPGTSRQNCPSSVRKFASRSISSPNFVVNVQSSRKKRTPTKTLRLRTLSQEVTPCPNYDAMNTPELKIELNKYGIKPQRGKRARKLLSHIYKELHTRASSTSSITDANINREESSDDDEPPVKKISKSARTSFSDSDSDPPLSQDSVVSEECPIIAEETVFLEVDDEIDYSSITIKQAFNALLNDDKKLHNKVLTYEPLPLEQLHSIFKSRGFKCKLNDLMDFLDEECITFQVQNQTARKKNKNQIKDTEKKGATKVKTRVLTQKT